MAGDDQTDTGTVARLAAARDPAGTTYLQPHHVAAANRLERLIRRAQVMQRVTMSYNPASAGGGRAAANHVETASDSAADARRKLNGLASAMPADCWGVVFDICGLGKGLQQIETERGWPRRSAKLVLRIGLDDLAARFGLVPIAEGNASSRSRHWLDQRLPILDPI